MGHKEWETDDFLDEFLDFDYKKPVPKHGTGKQSRGLPAEKTTKPKQDNKSFGLGREQADYKSYEALRHGNNGNAGEHASAPAETHDLRSSDAFKMDIPEPLSAKRSGASAAGTSKPAAPAEPAPALRKQKAAQKGKSAPASAAKPEPVRPAPAMTSRPEPVKPAPAMAAETEKAASASGLKGKLFGKRKHVSAAEIANEALGAAKKLVASDEDIPPEEIPAVPAAGVAAAAGVTSSRDGRKGKSARPAQASAPAEEKDELAELFRELDEAPAHKLSSEDNEALREAQQNAYDRYRGNYLKGKKKRASAGKVGWFPKWVSRFYVLALVAFMGAVTVMNVLPFGMLVAFYVIIGLLSLIIVIQLRKGGVKKWARGLASITAILLMGCFGVATAYAMGTLSFLDFTSVSNEKRVASITKEPFNVCISGMDVYGTIDEQGRSDVNMIVTINPKTEQILMTSIPRDYQIYMPDKDMAMDKLTHTGFYSIDTTIGAEENLLDTNINYYVKVNFTTVKAFIYAIGGIDVYSEYEFTPVKRSNWTVKKGWNHMDGKQALAFARERKAFIDGDNQRIKNQQAVFEAIIKKATSSKTMLLSYNKILSNLRDYFKMSFSSSELRSLLKLQLARNPQWKIYKNTIVGGNGSMPTYSTGNAYAYVMTQDPESIENAKTLINAVLEGKTLDKDDDDNVFVVGENADGESGESDGE